MQSLSCPMGLHVFPLLGTLRNNLRSMQVRSSRMRLQRKFSTCSRKRVDKSRVRWYYAAWRRRWQTLKLRFNLR